MLQGPGRSSPYFLDVCVKNIFSLSLKLSVEPESADEPGLHAHLPPLGARALLLRHQGGRLPQVLPLLLLHLVILLLLLVLIPFTFLITLSYIMKVYIRQQAEK